MSQKTNLFVDIAILAGFLVAYEPSLTGIPIHEWFALAFSSVLIVHLLLHWDWVVQVTRKFFRNIFQSSRLNYILNLALLVDFVTIMLSGVMISKSVLATFGLQSASDPAWRFLHSSSTDISLLLIGLHIALHWKWILSTTKRYLLTPFKRRPVSKTLQPALAVAKIEHSQTRADPGARKQSERV
jgi:hypothetical protein